MQKVGFYVMGLLAGVAICSAGCATHELTKHSVKIDGFTDTPMEPGAKWHVHDSARPQPQVVTPGVAFSQGAPAPSDAELLFGGGSLAKWETVQGKDATWKMQDDFMETAPRGGGIRTRGKWADFQLHVEWASPNPPVGNGQGRGNSGILINGLYEIQVLDSYKANTGVPRV